MASASPPSRHVQPLDAQSRYLDALRTRGWTISQIARVLGVGTGTVASWEAKICSARNTHQLALERLYSTSATPPDPQIRPGRPKRRERSAAEELFRTPDLSDPERRVRLINTLRATSGMSRVELATHLGISGSTLRNYLDPRCSHGISVPVLRKIATLLELERLGFLQRLNRSEHFDRTAKRLFGQYYYTGFKRGEAVLVAEFLQQLTLGSLRTIYRYLPPYRRSLRPGLAFLDRLDRVADMLLPRETVLDAIPRLSRAHEEKDSLQKGA